MNKISWIMVIFIFVLLGFLWLSRKNLVILALRKKHEVYYQICFSIILLSTTLIEEADFNTRIQGILGTIIILSFLINVRGLTKEGIQAFRFDNRGIPYTEINRIVLYAPPNAKKIKLNFFRNELRGPLLEFSQELSELEDFFKGNLPDDTKLEIITDENDLYV